MPWAHLTEVTTLSGESDVSWTKTAVTALMFLAVCLMSFIVVCLCDACLCLLQSGSVQSEKHLSPCEPELKFQLCGFISLLLSTTVRVHMRSQRSMERNRNTWCFYTAWKCYWKEEAGYKAACRESSKPLPFKGFSSGSLQLKSSHV